MELTVTDIGYGIAFGGGEPIYFGSMRLNLYFLLFNKLFTVLVTIARFYVSNYVNFLKILN